MCVWPHYSEFLNICDIWNMLTGPETEFKFVFVDVCSAGRVRLFDRIGLVNTEASSEVVLVM